MILSQAQAEAVINAMAQINNVGGNINRIDLSADIQVRINRVGAIQIWNDAPNAESQFESFVGTDAFRGAYNLN